MWKNIQPTTGLRQNWFAARAFKEVGQYLGGILGNNTIIS